MGYVYAEERNKVFTEDGQRQFLAIRDKAKECLAMSGAVLSRKLLGLTSGDTWTMLACIDRLVELGELYEIPNPRSRAGQHRVFIGKLD